MPYLQRATIYPNREHVAEVQALLETRVRGLREQGHRANLSRTVFGIDLPAFHQGVVFETMDAVEQFADAQAAASSTLLAQLTPLTRQANTFVLNDVLVATPAGLPPVAAGGYVVWITTKPLPERAREYGALSTEWVRTRGAQGFRMAIGRQIAGPDSGAYITSIAFDHLGEYQEMFARAAGEEAAQKYLSDSAPLLSTLPRTEILRVVIGLSLRP